MNSLYNNALKQSHALQKDLDSKVFVVVIVMQLAKVSCLFIQNSKQDKMLRLGYKVRTLHLSMRHGKVFIRFHIGQISASFNALQRHIDEYENLAKRELIPVKKETALT